MKATKVFTKIGFLPTFLPLIGIIILTMSSCDVVDPDADILVPSVDIKEKEVYVLSSGASFIDLQSRIQANESARIAVTSDPRHGTLSDLGKGMLQYSPSTSGSKARDGFEFTVYSSSNQVLKKDSVIIIIENDSTNLPCNLYPVTDYVYRVRSAGILIDVVSNDVICTDSVIVSVYKPQNDFPPYTGTAVVQGNKIFYKPASSFTGADKLMYKLTDVNHAGRIAFGMVYITNDSACVQVVRNDSYTYDSLGERQTIALPAFANDTLCYALNQYQISIVSPPLFGTASLGSNGFLYTAPDSVGYTFQDQFTYEICIDATCKSAKVQISQIRDLPMGCKIYAAPDSFDIRSAQTDLVLLNILKNDSICTSLKGIEVTKQPKYGSAYINTSNNTLAYTRNVQMNLNDSVSYRICNGQECSSTSVFIRRSN